MRRECRRNGKKKIRAPFPRSWVPSGCRVNQWYGVKDTIAHHFSFCPWETWSVNRCILSSSLCEERSVSTVLETEEDNGSWSEFWLTCYLWSRVSSSDLETVILTMKSHFHKCRGYSLRSHQRVASRKYEQKIIHIYFGQIPPLSHDLPDVSWSTLP